MRTRDLTKAQFDAACQRNGFRAVGWLGYYDLGLSVQVHCSILNAGSRRRDQIAYLISERGRWIERHPDFSVDAPA